jgi:hypothetical protein
MLRCEWKMMIILLAGFAAVGCAQIPAEETALAHNNLVACEDPRPQMCTAIYDPVCALKTDNNYQTYASGCTACGDANVSGYRSGACE